jgi:hypothetical protein
MSDVWDALEDWEDDDVLEAELRRLASLADPVPASVLEVAKAGLAWRTINADLAELSYDSMLEGAGAGTGYRGGPGRELTFESDGFVVDLQVAESTDANGRGSLLGQLVPSQEAVIEIRTPTEVMEVTADGLGRFQVPRPGPGPIRLCCRLADGRTAIATDWVTV